MLIGLCLAASINVLNAQVTLRVTEIPSNTPQTDAIYVAGDFQGWDPGDINYQLKEKGGDFWVTIPAGNLPIEFKFTRGSWSQVEANSQGQFRPNRKYSGQEGDTVELTIAGWEDLGGSAPSTAAENVHVITDSFYMPQLDRYRRIWVYLPPNYEDVSDSFPVLYLHDGQNVFDATTSFSGEWEVDETLNDLHSKGDPGVIAVAIDNGGGKRIDEYSPWVNSQYGGGEGGQYVNFLVKTLKPFIDSAYRTKSGPENTGIMGSSLGGHISTYAAMRFPHVFGKVGAFSPAYWINKEMLPYVYTQGSNQGQKIYQLAGLKESNSIVALTRLMHDTLSSLGFGSNQLLTVEKSDGQHSEWFWAREFEAAYIWLFQDRVSSVGSSISQTPFILSNPIRSGTIQTIDFQDEILQCVAIDGFGRVNYLTFNQSDSGRNTIEIPDTLNGWHTIHIRTNHQLYSQKVVIIR